MKKHAIIPIFIPHRGCPHDCVFCNQRKITARSGDIGPKDAEKTIEDYFKFVWIPARQNSHIDEIRYISKTHVNAVQVREEQSDLVYYKFKKEKGKWLVYIPPVQ